MLLRVVHQNEYVYAPPVKTAQHMAHLKPAHDAHQRLASHRLRIAPEPEQLREGVDVFGNTRAYFSVQSVHERLEVVADSLVSTTTTPPIDNDISWEDARERMRYQRGSHYDPAAGFAFASTYVPRHERLLEYALSSFTAGRPLVDAARELMHRIHEDFEYVAAATDVGTPALKAFELRQGVCQDFAHVMLGCLRSLGLAARYVSGYLLTEPPPGMPRLVGADASHAWLALYLPRADGAGEWMGLDPTNDRSPGEDYVRLATGRDYADVSPMRGVIQGGANHTLKVAVTVAPVPKFGA
ncbi:MAG TPA: transglutaminase family protein [Ramlibacter sp.]|uniref:transglutaminase family protein n=1 Tax=Ramlibacter sp. TaxID=1917967 RepID=UPI002CE947CB|nr:transglutaminase family protein [Ramlibacter sp.]HVZ46340.1 transglutaminase family protein [Ramlibacter sp.]